VSTVGTIAIFVVVWWIVLFMVLPFGVTRDESPVAGADPGAPARPYMLRKVLVTTVLAGLITWGIVHALSTGLIQFRPPAG
jgi:predicted secreted protein